MENYVIRNGFHPEQHRVYNGENIFTVMEDRIDPNGMHAYLLNNGVWINEKGPDMYVTEWTSEERWGRVEKDGKFIGFMILITDRSKGLL